MRLTGTKATGIRLPIISGGDNLADIVVESVVQTIESEGVTLQNTDVIGVTEAIVAKAQGNFASIDHIAEDVRNKFGDGVIGLVFPIFSRNRFLNILKGIAKGAEKVVLLLQYPADEVGNPIMDISRIDEVVDTLPAGPVPGSVFREATGPYKHPFTEVDYISLYQEAGDNIEVYVSADPRDILKLTPNVLVGEIHTRFRTRERLIKSGAKTVYTLSDILSTPVGDSGFNKDYGVLGSNISTGSMLKLFPRDCQGFAETVQRKLKEKTGVAPEVLVYGDGAFKDPFCGIWELADPVVSPGYTARLGGQPQEIKLKYVADNVFSDLRGEEKQKAVMEMIKNKKDGMYNEGTTPRKYADLLGSLCDLVSGSGDKGTPVILVQGYFDDYAAE